MKVVRPPYAVDRLILKDISKDPSASGLLLLSEYGTPSAAFTIHANDGKILKEWIDQLKKAQKLYAEAKERVSSLLATSSGLGEHDPNTGVAVPFQPFSFWTMADLL